MNVLGMGIPEILVIFVIMMVLFGPKQMVKWAYDIGRYTAKMRAMFQETMDAFQKEMNASGLSDVTKDLGKEVTNLRSTGFDIVSEASKVINNVDSEVKSTATAASTLLSDSAASEPKTTPPTSESPSEDENKPRYDAWTPS
jgi:Sec-independent protein translocase protein TatA